MKEVIRSRLLKAALAIAMGAAVVATYQAQQPSASVLLAMELGSHFESSGRHIGTPYVDKLGKGQPLTVCNGVTGAGVVAGRYYTPDDCKRLELPRYLAAERQARSSLRHWGTYNPWVQASFIDMVYNLGPGALDGTAIARLANAGDLDGACAQMPRWVRGTVAGQKVTLPGLVDRRATTQELCAEWGRTGHFSEHILEAKNEPHPDLHDADLVEGLEVIPGLYAYAATAIVAGALAFGGGWKVQAWRYDAQIADTASQHAIALASANQKALDDTIKMQRAKDDAIKAAQDRAKREAANAAVLRTERDGLRAQLAATAVQLPSASCNSVREYGTTLTGLLDQCAGAFEAMAREASGHAADSRLMQEAWPK